VILLVVRIEWWEGNTYSEVGWNAMVTAGTCQAFDELKALFMCSGYLMALS
jgi:hypothetical protein